jgi:hypothetical protein
MLFRNEQEFSLKREHWENFKTFRGVKVNLRGVLELRVTAAMFNDVVIIHRAVNTNLCDQKCIYRRLPLEFQQEIKKSIICGNYYH